MNRRRFLQQTRALGGKRCLDVRLAVLCDRSRCRDVTAGCDNRVLGKSAPESWNPVRESMGHTRRLAERLELAAMTPCEHLTSTGYCLADPGRQYVIYLPEGGRVEVDLSAAAEPLAVEWIAPIAETSHAGKPAAGGAKRSLQAPFRGPAVLLLEMEKPRDR